MGARGARSFRSSSIDAQPVATHFFLSSPPLRGSVSVSGAARALTCPLCLQTSPPPLCPLARLSAKKEDKVKRARARAKGERDRPASSAREYHQQPQQENRLFSCSPSFFLSLLDRPQGGGRGWVGGWDPTPTRNGKLQRAEISKHKSKKAFSFLSLLPSSSSSSTSPPPPPSAPPAHSTAPPPLSRAPR